MATEESILNLLKRRGWICVYVDDDPCYISPPGRPLGWIKPPKMRLHTMQEAYEKEGFVYADLRITM